MEVFVRCATIRFVLNSTLLKRYATTSGPVRTDDAALRSLQNDVLGHECNLLRYVLGQVAGPARKAEHEVLQAALRRPGRSEERLRKEMESLQEKMDRLVQEMRVDPLLDRLFAGTAIQTHRTRMELFEFVRGAAQAPPMPSGVDFPPEECSFALVQETAFLEPGVPHPLAILQEAQDVYRTAASGKAPDPPRFKEASEACEGRFVSFVARPFSDGREQEGVLPFADLVYHGANGVSGVLHFPTERLASHFRETSTVACKEGTRACLLSFEEGAVRENSAALLGYCRALLKPSKGDLVCTNRRTGGNAFPGFTATPAEMDGLARQLKAEMRGIVSRRMQQHVLQLEGKRCANILTCFALPPTLEMASIVYAAARMYRTVLVVRDTHRPREDPTLALVLADPLCTIEEMATPSPLKSLAKIVEEMEATVVSPTCALEFSDRVIQCRNLAADRQK